MRINKLKVQILMTRKSMSWAELASRMGKSPSAVSGLFTRNIRPDTANELCKALECDVKDIIA